jgi:hypothetical protein
MAKKQRRVNPQAEEEAGMIRFCGTGALVVLFAVLAGSAGGATGNEFCEIETSAVCATVVVQPTAENPCTVPPDTVTLSGTIHVAVLQDENQSRVHTNWQDVSGVGFPSGALYQANEATRFYEVQRPSGASTFVLQDERELLSQGEPENFILRQFIEITIDDDGVTTKTHGDSKCTG